MPEVPHDTAVGLRLELGRMTDKANALEAALRKEVLIVIREAAAENARLKAEVETLKMERIHDLNQIGGLQQELASLRASSFVTAVPVEQYEKLKAEVERLTADNEQLQNRCDFLEGKPSV